MTLAVLDTNVLVSGTLHGHATPPVCILRGWLHEQRFRLVVSPALLNEYRRVLFRPILRSQSPWTDEQIEELLFALETLAEVHVPSELDLQVCRDPRDDMFLIAAIEANADYLVSGDQDLLVLNPYETVNIITPTEFLLQVLEE